MKHFPTSFSDLALVGFRIAYDHFLRLQVRKKEDDKVMKVRRAALSRSLSKLLNYSHPFEDDVAKFDMQRTLSALNRSIVNGMHRGSFMSMLDAAASDRYEERRAQKEVSIRISYTFS